MSTSRHTRRAWLALPALASASLLALSGCAAILPHRDPLKVELAGLEPLAGEGLELRFLVKLRVQNPNEVDISYDGLAFDMELRGAPFASGVSPAAGTLARFGETTLAVPVSVSGLAMVRQLMSLARSSEEGGPRLPYVLRGKLGGGLLGTVRFESRGEVNLRLSR